MSTTVKITRDNLNELMAFDHVVQVHADGTVTDAPATEYAPECYVEGDSDGQVHADPDMTHSGGWQLLAGYTGQYGYNGAIMHDSEYIGGRLADDILATPGYYVALVVADLNDETGGTVGWAVARKDVG